MSSRPHRRNADLIDWRMLPLAVLSVALGGIVSYSAASSFGLGYVDIEQLPSTVAELAYIDKARIQTQSVTKSTAKINKQPVQSAPEKVVEPKTPKVVSKEAKEAVTADSMQPSNDSQANTPSEDISETIAKSVSVGAADAEAEEFELPDTAAIVARANLAAGVKPVSEQTDAEEVKKSSSRNNDNEYQEVRASLDPNSLPILRVTAPDSKKTETAAKKLEANKETSAGAQESLSKDITDAVDSGVVSRVLDLIDKGQPLDGVDEVGQTMLLKAAWNGDESMFDALLERGANINISSRDGRTPLFGATASGSLELVKKLVEKGAAVDAQTKDGKTPLMLSARSSYPEIALYLLEQGADPDIVDSKGRNALLYALWDRNIDVIRSLIQYGSNLDQVDNDGHATVDIARLRRIELPGMNLEETEESTN